MSTRNTENTTSLYWFGPPESKTLCLVLWLVLLGDCVIVHGVASSALYWPVDEVGSQTDSWSVTTRRPKSRLHLLLYPVDLLWSKSTDVLFGMPCLEVVLN
jgi:hypothetical protein